MLGTKSEAGPIPVLDRSVDLVTLAGSLFYVNFASLVVELKRVCRGNAFIIPYDFYVSLEGVLDESQVESTNEYDPTVNLSGITEFVEISVNKDRIDLELTPSELAYLVLATSFRFEAVSRKFDTMAPFAALHRELIARSTGPFSVKAEIFYSKCHLRKWPTAITLATIP